LINHHRERGIFDRPTVLLTLWTINLLRPVLIVSAINYASGAQYCGKESENNSTISNLMCVLLMRVRFGERERERERRTRNINNAGAGSRKLHVTWLLFRPAARATAHINQFSGGRVRINECRAPRTHAAQLKRSRTGEMQRWMCFVDRNQQIIDL
jgi:hypothetical protein